MISFLLLFFPLSLVIPLFPAHVNIPFHVHHTLTTSPERWTYHGNLFDVTYHDHYWTNTSSRQAIYTQESPPDYQPGTYLPERAFGSHPLKILNVANPVVPNVFSVSSPFHFSSSTSQKVQESTMASLLNLKWIEKRE